MNLHCFPLILPRRFSRFGFSKLPYLKNNHCNFSISLKILANYFFLCLFLCSISSRVLMYLYNFLFLYGEGIIFCADGEILEQVS